MIRAILTDIEGTTSSLSFVKDVLFPYSRERMADFVRGHGADPAVARLLEEAQQAAATELDDGELIAQLIAWIDEDRKITPLKALQGLIWEDGYRRGDFTGHVYEDAVRQLRNWKRGGRELYIFSSGSVHAQKLLFSHTDYGDLTPLFSGFFDTTIGHKRETKSYEVIASAIGLEPGEILFLSDIRQELDAAREADLQTIQLVRDGEPDPTAPHPQVRDFDAIQL
jgi:enolase-phosphatase E1